MINRFHSWINRYLLYKKKNRDCNITFKGSCKPILLIGDHSYLNDVTIFCWDENFSLTIGKYCSIADDVTIIAGGEHHQGWISTYPFIDRWSIRSKDVSKPSMSKGNITIGNDVWIGNRATILSGVSIATGAIIGAGAVVTKDVPSYGIAVGNPAKVVKYRFSDEIITRLLKSEWWDLDEYMLNQNVSLMKYPEDFLNKVGF